MSLNARLQLLHRELGMPETVEALPPAAVTPPRDRFRLVDRLPGLVEVSVDGRLLVADTVLSSETVHGLHAFSRVTSLSPAGMAMVSKDPELEYTDLTRCLFLDTETTGLGMGAGTYVFLVGAGFLDGTSFRVKQFFLTSPSHEGTFLDSLSEFLADFSTVVSFNGKAFDLPLLENRFVMHRRQFPLRARPHIDLLHPARRLWKRRLESCALSSLEAAILGLARTQEDVPGWEIPSRYFRYQRTGDSRELEGVFYHNLQDILSLAALTVHVDRLISDPVCGLVTDGVDFLCLGKTFARGGDVDTAVRCFEEALRRPMIPADRADCLIRLSTLQKRERRWDAAITIWETLVDEGGDASLYGRVELAKYYEHVEHDYISALDHVQHALRKAELFEAPWPDASERDLNHRLSRLLNRSMRNGDWSGMRS